MSDGTAGRSAGGGASAGATDAGGAAVGGTSGVDRAAATGAGAAEVGGAPGVADTADVVGALSDSPDEVAVTRREVTFAGRVWDVLRDDFRYNDETLTREYLDHPGAVAIVAIDDDERVLLINQYRHPVRQRLWEVPAGLLDVADERPLEAAKRELAEEADVTATRWSVLAEYYTTPGSSSEAIRIYLARGIDTTHDVFARHGEEADIEVRWVPLSAAVEAVLARRIQNPSLVVGLLAAEAARARDWRTLSPEREPWPRHPRWGGGARDGASTEDR